MVTVQSSTTKVKSARTRKYNWPVVWWARAYGASLIITSVAFPIVATGVTICFYLAPPVDFPWLSTNSHWYAPVYGFLTTCCIWFLFALLRSRFATASGANMRVYEDLKSRFSELEMRLINIRKIQIAAKPLQNEDEDELYCKDALSKVTNAKDDLDDYLFHKHSSTEWTLGIGYVNAWRLIHRAYESLVEFEPLQEVIGEVIHDIRSIQNSSIPDSNSLIRKMLQAVKDLRPEAMVYFEELRTDKNYSDLFDGSVQVQSHQTGKPLQPNPDLEELTTKKLADQRAWSIKIAREAIQQVKHSLYLYQDSLRHTLVRSRNHIYTAITLTGLVTYFLTCMVILWNATQYAIGTATVYYMIGAVTGLFVRFYKEANIKDAPSDDYGLFLSRLFATPLLSGLAALGGVLIAATLPTLSGQKAPELSTIFNSTVTIEYFFAAAIFGYAPNLIIGSLQQRAQKFSTDLQNSQGEGSS
jgi:hypothetical protein